MAVLCFAGEARRRGQTNARRSREHSKAKGVSLACRQKANVVMGGYRSPIIRVYERKDCLENTNVEDKLWFAVFDWLEVIKSGEELLDEGGFVQLPLGSLHLYCELFQICPNCFAVTRPERILTALALHTFPPDTKKLLRHL